MDLQESKTLYQVMTGTPRDLFEKRLLQEADDELVTKAAGMLEDDGDLFPAMELYDKIDAHERVVQLGDRMKDEEQYLLALDAYQRAEDHGRLEALARQSDDEDIVYEVLDYDLDMIEPVTADLRQWVRDRGIDTELVVPARALPRSAAMAQQTAQRYDRGIGIANGGLFLAYLYDRFGLETSVIEYHRERDEAPRWHGEGPGIADEDVLLIDEDLVTGETVQEVGESIGAEPSSYSLALQRGANGHYGSNMGNVPGFIDEVHTLGNEALSGYFDSVEALHERMR